MIGRLMKTALKETAGLVRPRPVLALGPLGKIEGLIQLLIPACLAGFQDLMTPTLLTTGVINGGSVLGAICRLVVLLIG